MTRSEAKRILLLYRPGTGDAEDPSLAEALAEARRDPELQRWFDQHCAFQRVLRKKFRQIPVPADLKARLLAGGKIIRPVRLWWQQPSVLAAAAVLILLAIAASLWLPRSGEGTFEQFRSRMVRNALRQYGMDIVTNRMDLVRQYISSRGAPSDYVVPEGLKPLSLTGGGVLRFRSQPVSMVCFDRGDQQMLFLFVVDRAAVDQAPEETPRVVQVNKLLTASWSQDNRTYLLAGPAEADFVEKYLSGTL